VWTHLGPRTLRTPTGALAALALLMERTVPSEASGGWMG
jgi:16S rRNA U1498 N3-methylase RsmE